MTEQAPVGPTTLRAYESVGACKGARTRVRAQPRACVESTKVPGEAAWISRQSSAVNWEARRWHARAASPQSVTEFSSRSREDIAGSAVGGSRMNKESNDGRSPCRFQAITESVSNREARDRQCSMAGALKLHARRRSATRFVPTVFVMVSSRSASRSVKRLMPSEGTRASEQRSGCADSGATPSISLCRERFTPTKYSRRGHRSSSRWISSCCGLVVSVSSRIQDTR